MEKGVYYRMMKAESLYGEILYGGGGANLGPSFMGGGLCGKKSVRYKTRH